MFLELLLFVNYSRICRGCVCKADEESLHAHFCKYFPDFDKLFRTGSSIYAGILVGAKKTQRVSRRLLKISKLFGMSQILMRRFFGRREHWYYVAVNLHMIYWMTKPIIEIVSRFNDPRFIDFSPFWGARQRLLPAPSHSSAEIKFPNVKDYRFQNAGLNFFMRIKCIGKKFNFFEIIFLINWAIEAENEVKDADERMFGSSYPMMSVSQLKEYSCGDILHLLEQSDILPRALCLFLGEKENSIHP